MSIYIYKPFRRSLIILHGEMAEQRSGYRLNCINLFLTYPKCLIVKEEALEQLKVHLPIKEYIIATENHEDGTPHLHAFIALHKKVDIRSATLLDLERDGVTYHGNYQSSKNKWATMKYCMKGDDYISNIEDLEERKKCKDSKKRFIGAELITGQKTLRAATDENPELLWDYDRLRKNIALYQEDKRREELELARGQDEQQPPSYKKRHIWLHGPSDCGKSTKLRGMIALYGESECFQIPYNNDWCGYAGERYLYADEYKGQLTIQELNRVCDGGAKVNVKGSTTTLCKLPQVVVVSNYSISDCYHKADQVVLKALYNRFEEMEYDWKTDPNAPEIDQ
jgi:hypothetical protein